MSFTLMEKCDLKDVKSIGYVYRHTSGCILIYLCNDDENKVFSATFKTPPRNDKGTPHILEHCLFCGSQKYRVKDPFHELLKGSVNTFLNAMTFKDKTMYPIASCNEKDFYNLMTVYLDTIFCPLIKERPESFLQEGWNYQINEKSEIIGYGGIVYNEMKGVYSDPISIYSNAAYKKLFPDTQYAYDSGGVPEHITNLTYEEFVEFYDTHYCPANSYIYLYGRVNIELCMEIIDKQLSAIENAGSSTEIKFQIPPQYPEEIVRDYYIANTVTAPRKYVGTSYVIGNVNNAKLMMAFNILCNYLIEMQASPPYKAIIGRGMGKEIKCMLNSSICQPVFSIVVKGSEIDAQELKTVIDAELENILINGMNKELMDSCINKYEFAMLEENHGRKPKGLDYNFIIMTDLLYGHSPFNKLKRKEVLAGIKENTEYFKDIIQNCLLVNKHYCLVELLPTQAESNKLVLETKLNKQNINEQSIIEDVNKLKIFSETKDSLEDLEQMPLLEIKDINSKVEKIPLEVHDGLIHCPLDTNNILYFNFMFSTDCVPQKYLPYIGLLCYLLGKLPTEHYTLEEIVSNINMDTGGFYPSFKVYNNVQEYTRFKPNFVLKVKVLAQKYEKVFVYVREVLFNTLFDNRQNIQNYLGELLSKMNSRYINEGHNMAMDRVHAQLFTGAMYEEHVNGYEFYIFLKLLTDNFDMMFNEFKQGILETTKYIFTKEAFTLTTTCSYSEFEMLKPSIKDFKDNLPEEFYFKVAYNFMQDKSNLAYIADSKVQYVVKGFNYNHFLNYTGKLAVLAFVLSNDYLTKGVRINGGAYGCNCRIDKKGFMCFYSYRDPNIKKTLDVYNAADEFIREYKPDARELRKIIIGTVNLYLKPMHVYEKGEFAINTYFNGITHEMLAEERRQILETTAEDIRGFAQAIKNALETGVLCVLGGDEAIREGITIFDKIRNL